MSDPRPLPWEEPLGAVPTDGGRTSLRVWAPRTAGVAVVTAGGEVPLEPAGGGVFAGEIALAAGEDYRLRPAGGEPLPDPCSRHQPEGVRGPSRVVDPGSWDWTDDGWEGLSLPDLVVYELHVGTFTPEGTFAGVVPRLAALRELGVTAIELMPVATFPGNRNWGYDGLHTWAPHPAYGGPDGLAALVDAAHAEGLGVILDVVYNHLGPGSEALEAFGPYLSEKHGTPWGKSVNFDDADCGGVREWAIQNACMWVRDLHLDGLRVDAVHAIHDEGARHVLAELTERVRAAARFPPVLIAESDLNDPRTVTPVAAGGWGFDGQWADDHHHALHARLTGERDGYYGDFAAPGTLADAAAHPFVYRGGYQPSRRRRHGAPPVGIPPERFVACSQNHDQVGNRAAGDRPPAATRRLAALWTLLAPWTPMLFMGEEHGEQRPFQFFTDHIDPFIADATREGRKREFAGFEGFRGEVPDPQDPGTFARSVIDPEAGDPAVRDLYRRLLALRRDLPRVVGAVRHDEGAGWIAVARGPWTVLGNFGDDEAEVPVEATAVELATHDGVTLGGGALSLPPLSGAVLR
ncbi:MAG: malto-oligosyltrehalose trehalohydrolase [Thermoleophilia bacterium]